MIDRMNFPVDVWLRGTDFATTETIDTVSAPPASWTDDDVRGVLEAMLRVMNRSKNPSADAHDRAARLELDRQSLRGWRRGDRH